MANALTELENCTLGLISQFQPCSTYRIRSEFAHSSTAEWSASAGSIYPVIERLLRLKLIKSVKRAGDGRGRRDLRITPKGTRAVRDWIMSLDPRIVSATPDPIRSRAYFLNQLKSVAEQRAFLARAEAHTRAVIRSLRAQTKAARAVSMTDYLGASGALFQLEARMRWLRVVRRVLGEQLVSS